MTEYLVSITDDRPNEARKLEGDIRAWFRGKGPLRVDSYTRAEDMLAAFRPGKWQIAFLDIVMNGMNGIELAKKLRAADARLLIVFLTGSREYAFDAFPVHPFDYLTKPHTPERLAGVLSEALRVLTEEDPEIMLRVDRTVVPLSVGKIVSASSQGHAVEILTTDGTVLRSIMTFTDLERLLGAHERFLVCNRGLLVNMDHVLTLEEDCLRMTDGSVCPLRTKGRAEIVSRFTGYQIRRMKKGGGL